MENNRLFQIKNSIVKPIKIKAGKWLGGIVFPKNMPGRFRMRAGTSNGYRYKDTLIEINQNNNLKFYPGTYIYAGPFHIHFGHALTESIHRLWAFNNKIYDGIVFSLCLTSNTQDNNYIPPQWFIQTLEVLEIPLAKCIWVKNTSSFENLIVPEPGSELALGLKNWYRSYLEKVQKKIFDTTYNFRKESKELKLFLGRNHIPLSGYTVGEKYLESLLVDEGYISLKPENYHILQQIAYLMNAKKIIFSEGSAIYSLEIINYLEADIACIPRRRRNQSFYPHIDSKCRNYIVAGNSENILQLGVWRQQGIKQMPINKHPYQVVESLRKNNFASLLNWNQEDFFAQERCDIMTYIYQVHNKLDNPQTVDYLDIIEKYLQVRTNSNQTSNDNRNNNSIVMKSSSDRLNQLARINRSSNYLEIGVAKGVTFNAVKLENKVAVDPKFKFNTNKYATENKVFLEVTGDKFFSDNAKRFKSFDLIYLNGIHTFEQAFRDFCASVSLAHGNTIWLINNTSPESYAQVQPLYQNCAKLKQIAQEKGGAWMGDVFKVVAAIHDFFPQFSFATFPDHGQTVIWNQWREDFQPLWNSLETISRLEYLDFVELQETLFKRKSYDEIFASIKSAIS